MTLAVRPAALAALPDVYTARGMNSETYCKKCDLAVDGSARSDIVKDVRGTSQIVSMIRVKCNGKRKLTADNADVNVAAQPDPLRGALVEAAEEHQQDAALDVFVAEDFRRDRLGHLHVQLPLLLHVLDLAQLRRRE